MTKYVLHITSINGQRVDLYVGPFTSQALAERRQHELTGKDVGCIVAVLKPASHWNHLYA